MAFKIITDSASDLPRELIDKYQIHVIPTPVTIKESPAPSTRRTWQRSSFWRNIRISRSRS